MSNALATVPQGLALPAHLQTPEAAAQIAAANAAAAGGIKTGGFPKISIEGGKFHEIDSQIDGGAPRTYMVAAQPGQPPLPMMCLEAVIIAANPALIKTFYAKKWQKGDAEAPDCQSSNGVTPDAHIAKPQSAVCATCPQNQWGSKISEASGKEIKACSDSKQLVILPAADLTYKALGLAITPAALGDWGKYVKALSDRNIPVNSAVTNITFDHTASFPKLQFQFNRFLTAEEYGAVVERASGDDVKTIVNPVRTIAPALPAPAATPALAASVPAPASAPFVPPVQPAPAPTPPAAQVPAPAGFGAAPAAPAAPATPPPATPPAPAPRVRRTRAQIDAEKAAAAGQIPAAAAPDLSHLPAAIRATVDLVGADSPAGKALLAQFPAPAAAQPAPAPAAAVPSAPAPVASAPAVGGFGATVAAPATPAAPAAGAAAAGASLKELLMKKLGNPPTPPAAG